MTVQIRNAEMVDLLKADFQHRNEPNFAWKSACSAFQALPGLRGFWPMSAFDSNGDCYDQSGHGHTLAYIGDPAYNAYDLAPYIDLDGTGDYLNRADEADLDIIGNEAYVHADIQGLTMGGWFWRDVQQQQGFMGKCRGGAGYSYRILNTGVNDTLTFDIWDAGAVNRPVSSTSQGTGAWEFVVGKFDPNNNQILIYIDNQSTSAAIPGATTLQNGTSNFVIGTESTNDLDGRASLCFLCAAALPDVTLFSLYQQTRRLFYV